MEIRSVAFLSRALDAAGAPNEIPLAFEVSNSEGVEAVKLWEDEDETFEANGAPPITSGMAFADEIRVCDGLGWGTYC